eukprot:365569-Chlamydomonas_euryale.AAC.23
MGDCAKWEIAQNGRLRKMGGCAKWEIAQNGRLRKPAPALDMGLTVIIAHTTHLCWRHVHGEPQAFKHLAVSTQSTQLYIAVIYGLHNLRQACNDVGFVDSAMCALLHARMLCCCITDI